jgi:hypothetical protein
MYILRESNKCLYEALIASHRAAAAVVVKKKPTGKNQALTPEKIRHWHEGPPDDPKRTQDTTRSLLCRVGSY